MVKRIVAWFSCGSASAVAAKLALEENPSAVVAYCDTLATEHPDNARFLSEVEKWIGTKILILSSRVYKDIDAVFEKRRYLSGIKGAPCTYEMKKRVREEFQFPDDTHVFGYTSEESKRAERFEDQNPSLNVDWILIRKGITKKDCHRIITDAGIKSPILYSMGFDHNNCIGCVKSSSPGYWNRTRRIFPDAFARRVDQSERFGVKLVRIGGKRISLKDLPPDAEEPDDAIDCGPACQNPEEEK